MNRKTLILNCKNHLKHDDALQALKDQYSKEYASAWWPAYMIYVWNELYDIADSLGKLKSALRSSFYNREFVTIEEQCFCLISAIQLTPVSDIKETLGVQL